MYRNKDRQFKGLGVLGRLKLRHQLFFPHTNSRTKLSQWSYEKTSTIDPYIGAYGLYSR